jgi:type IV pilus assembly protein PilM
LNVPTTIANPLGSISFGAHVDIDSLNRDAPSLLMAFGLALRDLG